MARLSLQVKNIASLALALGTSVASGVSAKRFFESPRKPWGWLAVAAACFFLCQVVLVIFIESKEEEELSLLRTQRLARSRHAIEENEMISLEIRKNIELGDHEAARHWDNFRRQKND